MSEHTPGPWRIDPDCNAYIIGPHFETICKTWIQLPNNRDIRPPAAEDRANAELIARAPQMEAEIAQLRADLAAAQDARDAARQDTAAARDELGAANARWIEARNERDAALRLLAEAAPKCRICGAIANWRDSETKVWLCDKHHDNTSEYEQLDVLGTSIAALLAGQPVADTEKEALRAACKKALEWMYAPTADLTWRQVEDSIRAALAVRS